MSPGPIKFPATLSIHLFTLSIKRMNYEITSHSVNPVLANEMIAGLDEMVNLDTFQFLALVPRKTRFKAAHNNLVHASAVVPKRTPTISLCPLVYKHKYQSRIIEGLFGIK
jgi:hypothetical protein